ncbi:uracil-DNA glycosylase [Polynucleobacter kasalickyi]|uniref:Uracil-DNA glycosylase n=1 Tax=Polynucleobacter kasalickyi TaxID=1938817 RepID=A0A1W2AFF3_9BURK|nr:uracil-DNA glycosylase [Polynucleobacter kasalickyi]SMC59427.1 Uracil-DNA glycosylase [Polynucleobacter kasalickyi]
MDYLSAFLHRLPKDYQALLAHRLEDSAWIQLLENIQRQEETARNANPQAIFPSVDRVFYALELTPIQTIKVILLGQDPYHTAGLAQGLAFSVPQDILPGSNLFPSSLRNINKALMLEGYRPMMNGDLTHWATQGVLLLNACLTVQEGLPNSHVRWGWNQFTDALIHDLLQQLREKVVFLWGGFAQKKEVFIPTDRNHLILKSSHPSGLGVYKTSSPFLQPKDTGSCKHFSLSNAWLNNHLQSPINW